MDKKVIQCDSRQKWKHHLLKESYFRAQGYELINSKMLAGDYCFPSKMDIVVDTKKNLSELYNNLIQSHSRFHNECVRALDCGIQLVILTENVNGIKCIDDVKDWENPRMKKWFRDKKKALSNGYAPPKPPATNVQLVTIMHSMTRDYGVRFEFCAPNESGKRVIEILEGKYAD